MSGYMLPPVALTLVRQPDAPTQLQQLQQPRYQTAATGKRHTPAVPAPMQTMCLHGITGTTPRHT
jgi:hypothetical protein